MVEYDYFETVFLYEYHNYENLCYVKRQVLYIFVDLKLVSQRKMPSDQTWELFQNQAGYHQVIKKLLSRNFAYKDVFGLWKICF